MICPRCQSDSTLPALLTAHTWECAKCGCVFQPAREREAEPTADPWALPAALKRPPLPIPPRRSDGFDPTGSTPRRIKLDVPLDLIGQHFRLGQLLKVVGYDLQVQRLELEELEETCPEYPGHACVAGADPKHSDFGRCIWCARQL